MAYANIAHPILLFLKGDQLHPSRRDILSFPPTRNKS
jgi:hypothetical protein